MIVIRPVKPSPQEQWSLWGTVRAMWVTLLHLLRHLGGFATRKISQPTLSAPEEKPVYTGRTRLMHRLTTRPGGAPKCVACELCSTVCPADAIEMIAEESPDPVVERQPLSFVIDELRCVFCGFCVDACPKDALRMDSVVDTRIATNREAFLRPLHELVQQPPRPDAYPGDLELDSLEKNRTK
jgi:NADH-quinone oxidoreductase subunit I